MAATKPTTTTAPRRSGRETTKRVPFGYEVTAAPAKRKSTTTKKKATGGKVASGRVTKTKVGPVKRVKQVASGLKEKAEGKIERKPGKKVCQRALYTRVILKLRMRD